MAECELCIEWPRRVICKSPARFRGLLRGAILFQSLDCGKPSTKVLVDSKANLKACGLAVMKQP